MLAPTSTISYAKKASAMSDDDVRLLIEGSKEPEPPSAIAKVTKKVKKKVTERVTGNGKIEAPTWPDVTEEGEPKRTYSNARAAITALGVICSYDEFHDRMLVAGHPINEWAGELSDAVNVMLRQIIINEFGFDPGKDNIADAATELCLENRFDSIIDYLARLKWDGTPRLDKWLSTYLGVEDSTLNQAIGRLTLIAAVRRARKPGCKFDHILTLEGREGTMKSTSIVTLAGIDNFSDQTILTASDKEQQELVRGAWLYEIADLAGMRRGEVEKIKAFASRTHDRARPAYGRRRVDAPRRCIFIGTTNDDEYLQSQTGNRRFWPVKTGTIDIDALRQDRDQLWAEAADVEAKGDPLVLPKELWAEASSAQDERRQHDPWDDVLANVPGAIYSSDDGTELEWIKAQELLHLLDIKSDRTTTEIYKRLKNSMNRLGWAKGRHYFGGRQQVRGYCRKTQDAKTDETAVFKLRK
jgi:predicted P-loop ATPase